MEKIKVEKLKRVGVKTAKIFGKIGASMAVSGIVTIATFSYKGTGVKKIVIDVSKFVAMTALSYKLMDAVEDGVDRYVEDWCEIIDVAKDLIRKGKVSSEKTEG